MAPRLSQGSAVERRIGFDLVGCLGRALQEGEHLVRATSTLERRGTRHTRQSVRGMAHDRLPLAAVRIRDSPDLRTDDVSRSKG